MLWTENAWRAGDTAGAAYRCANGHVIDPALQGSAQVAECMTRPRWARQMANNSSAVCAAERLSKYHVDRMDADNTEGRSGGTSVLYLFPNIALTFYPFNRSVTVTS